MRDSTNIDDIYEGFDAVPPSFDAGNIFSDQNIQTALKTASKGRRPMCFENSGGRMRMGTAIGSDRYLSSGFGTCRPMTSVRAAGFSSNLRRSTAFGKFSVDASTANHSATEPRSIDIAAPPLEQKPEDSPETQMQEMEKKVTQLYEESCLAAASGNISVALEKAKEAGRKERVLVRQREQLGVADQINLDLTYSILFNLANCYELADLNHEALNTYQAIVRNKMFSHAGRLKVNMGNIYFRQKNYTKAIKMYRMGLDQVPKTHKSMRIKIMQNIGIAFAKLRQYNDAITAFEHIMQEDAGIKAALNLILCYFKIGDKNNMKYTFQRLLKVDSHLDDEERYLSQTDDKQYDNILEVIKNDDLRQYEKNRKAHAESVIKMVAKIIAPAIEANFNLGYTWCIEQTKNSAYRELPNDLEIDKALMYLRQRDFHPEGNKSLHFKAIETLKSFENKDTRTACTAATNLSFLYFLEGDFAQADRYANQALAADRYSPAALVNKGNILFKQGQLDRARDCYREALQDDPTCVEALYNFGLVAKQLDRLEEALDAFYKIHSMLPNNVLVMYQMMDIYERMGDLSQSQDWFLQIHGLIPSDPFLLQHCGDCFERIGDKSQAFSYYYDSFKYYPCNFEVIEWLGAYYVESQFCEKSIGYFERAALMQPNQIKWQLMIASCHRKSGNYQQALEMYKKIHSKFPENIECLQFLVRLHKDMGLPETDEYLSRLKKAEKIREAREQRVISASSRQPLNIGAFGQPNESLDSISGGSRDSSATTRRRMQGSYTRSSSHVLSRLTNRLPPAASSSSLQLPDTDAEYEDEHEDSRHQYRSSTLNPMEVAYVDPLGPSVERPRTTVKTRRSVPKEFADDYAVDNLLPD
ncbi:intraflagellar transport protein 88 [Echinococcus multilocularis]|uniref:Intraflagellar transport protein 88 n=1 Tax=Echinococcus multilocularis TaxID=6211 RepID=A0A068YFQ8_ECHMU|nr:intraflagellar transport protein 88 [Echinococcus multilocularis]